MTLLLRMRNEMSQMQVGKMAAVGDLRELVTKDVDLDAADPPLAATKSGPETHLDERETSTSSSQADVASNSVCSSVSGDGEPPLPGKAFTSLGPDESTCVTSVAQCNHLDESDSNVTKPSPSPSPAAIASVCAVTNSAVDAGEMAKSCPAVTSANVNNTDDPGAVAAVSHTPETPNVAQQAVSTAAATTAHKGILSSLQSTAPGSPRGVTMPSIRTNAVNMVMPAAITPSASIRTIAPRVIVSTSPATTVLRVQSAVTNVTAQPLPTVPSQQLIMPVRNQATAVPRVLHHFFELLHIDVLLCMQYF